MIKNPLVTIIINCFNGESYLKEAIESVYDQTYDNWEIIFWDNCSTDNSSYIAKSFDNNLKYYLATEKTSLGEARNHALMKAKGDYVAFLDCDDLWLKHKLQSQIELLRNNGNDQIGFVYGRCELFFHNKEEKSKNYKQGEVLPSGKIFSLLIKENFISFLTAIIDRKKLIECGGFPDEYMHAEDYWIFLNLSKKYDVRATQEICSRYRIHDNNLSKQQYVLGAQETIEIVRKFLPDNLAMKALSYHYLNLSIAYFKEKKYISSASILYKHNLWIFFIGRLFDQVKKFSF